MIVGFVWRGGVGGFLCDDVGEFEMSPLSVSSTTRPTATNNRFHLFSCGSDLLKVSINSTFNPKYIKKG